MRIRITGLVSIALILSVFCNIPAQAQKRCGCCYDSIKAKRIDIVGEQLKQKPYTAIVKLFVNSNKFRGTGAFIAKDILITAKHNLFEYKFPKTLYLHVNTNFGRELVTLRKKDYEILYKGGEERENDIALIRITNVTKIRNLDVSYFDVEEYAKIIKLVNDTINVTGYSCDKEVEKPGIRELGDTLTNKYIFPVEDIFFNSDKTIMAFYTCGCAGDSGAPLWVSINNCIYIIGIYKGKSNFIDNKKITSIAVLLNKEKVDWLNGVLKE
ncbi:MAG: trypsin-like serine protease [Chitinophagaceae bacterium]|nr:trypsin-like serine protease [Chitinophagaceae bacterium]